jgi:hypothetical protein
MEPEGSSPYTQEPATCPYPEPDQPSLRPHTQPYFTFFVFFKFFIYKLLNIETLKLCTNNTLHLTSTIPLPPFPCRLKSSL